MQIYRNWLTHLIGDSGWWDNAASENWRMPVNSIRSSDRDTHRDGPWFKYSVNIIPQNTTIHSLEFRNLNSCFTTQIKWPARLQCTSAEQIPTIFILKFNFHCKKLKHLFTNSSNDQKKEVWAFNRIQMTTKQNKSTCQKGSEYFQNHLHGLSSTSLKKYSPWKTPMDTQCPVKKIKITPKLHPKKEEKKLLREFWPISRKIQTH